MLQPSSKLKDLDDVIADVPIPLNKRLNPLDPTSPRSICTPNPTHQFHRSIQQKQPTMAAGDEVKVLGSWISPFSNRARIALKLKGVEYEFLQEPFGVKSELLLQSNPVYKKIPVLIHNGKPISESMIIVEYIDQVWSSSGVTILPTDPYDRAIARFWAFYVDDKLYPNLRGIVMAQTMEAKVELAAQLSASLLLLEEAFAKCSKGKGFFGGETIGYLDIALGVYSTGMEAAGRITGVKILDEEKVPLLVEWVERFKDTEAVKGLIPAADALMEMAKKLKETYGSASPAQ